MTFIRIDNSDSKVSIRKYLFLLPLFITASFFIYSPVLHHFFVSDDFKVLFRVCIEKIIFVPGFFRPLSDLTIYANYVAGGLNPVWFNSFNILIHGLNSYFLFLFCFRLAVSRDRSKAFYFAILSSVFFICYPFHNETIVWILGRGSGMACLFALSGLLCYYYIINSRLKILLSCICYFISIAAFESTIIFPLIMLLVLIIEKQDYVSKRKWAFALALTFFFHLIFRYLLSGSILGSYGKEFFHSSAKRYILNIAKTGGRLILPPSNNAIWLTWVFVLLILISVIYIIKNLNRFRENIILRNLAVLFAMLGIANIVPIVVGVSTQTSESDRLLYFPSVFVCMIWAFGIVFMVRRPALKRILIYSTITYNLIFLELNNLNWRKASFITSSILEKINERKQVKDSGRLFFLNIPNEIQGAYVFRLGFMDALKLYGVDSLRFIPVNYLQRNDLEKIKEKNILNISDTEIVLPPHILLKRIAYGSYQIFENGKLKYTSSTGDEVYYWNTKHLELIP
jgi:hypothetical protein